MKKMVQVPMHGPSVDWKLYDSIVEERNQNVDCPALIDLLDLVVFMLCMEHSEVVWRRQNGELMVYSKPCTTCLMNPLQKDKITKILLDLSFSTAFLWTQMD